MEELILIGGGGHCKACIDVIECEGRFRIAGILDVRENVGSQVLGYKVIGTDEDIEALHRTQLNFFVALGQIKSASRRVDLNKKLKDLGAKLPYIVSPKAHVSQHAAIGAGTIVMHHALVNVNAVIGAQCILNSGCIVEHDARVADFCHISTGAIINGGAVIGQGCFIGSNATIKEGVHVAQRVILGAGAVAIKDCEEAGTYVGCPARRIN